MNEIHQQALDRAIAFLESHGELHDAACLRALMLNSSEALLEAAPASEPTRDVLTERLKTAINKTLNVLEEAKADADWGLTEAIICISFELKAILEAAREGK